LVERLWMNRLKTARQSSLLQKALTERQASPLTLDNATENGGVAAVLRSSSCPSSSFE
jgi:hypothetical protein